MEYPKNVDAVRVFTFFPKRKKTVFQRKKTVSQRKKTVFYVNQPKADARGMAAAFRAAILAALRCEGVAVELCGSWLWATGNTKAHKDELKAAGYKWSQNKAAWYWHTPGYIKRSKHDWTLDDIRSRFGSQQFAADADNDSDRDKIPA